MQEYVLKVSRKDSTRRLDLFLFDFFQKKAKGFSRTYIQDLIQKGKVKIKGRDKVKAHYRLKPEDEISIYIEKKKQTKVLPENIPLEVIYEDEDLAVINKPSGLVVHPGAGNYEHTLVNALLYYFKNLSDINPERPGIVHRLDKDTSGLMVIAKNNLTHLALSSQFAKHSIERQYVAIVKGKMEFDENIIELPLGRHPIKRKQMSVSFNSKRRFAKTQYRTLKRYGEFSLLELEPYTGRTHQLRVHLAYINHPILGDMTYGKEKNFPRLALHAKLLGFIHPGTKKFVQFTSDLPEEFKEFLSK